MLLNVALVGRNISHSLSKSMYEDLLGREIDYNLLDYSKESEIPFLKTLFQDFELGGLSITSPYKKHFVGDVTFESELVSSLGIINCIKKEEDLYVATNTDLLACKVILSKFLDMTTSKIILLGNGDMANVFKLLLKEKGLDYKQYYRSRDGDLSSLDLSLGNEKSLIINCCSRSFSFAGAVGSKDTFWDLNYGHDDHQSYLTNKCQYVDGLELLRLQAKFALKFWNIA